MSTVAVPTHPASRRLLCRYRAHTSANSTREAIIISSLADPPPIVKSPCIVVNVNDSPCTWGVGVASTRGICQLPAMRLQSTIPLGVSGSAHRHATLSSTTRSTSARKFPSPSQNPLFVGSVLLILLNDGDPRMKLLPHLNKKQRETRESVVSRPRSPRQRSTRRSPPLPSSNTGCALYGPTTNTKQKYKFTPS